MGPRYPTQASRDEYTALPTHVPAQPDTASDVEEGLSLDPEDLGAYFLSWAVEQGETDWTPVSYGDEGYEDDTPPLVDALDLEDADERIIRSAAWERTLRRALMRGPPLAGRAAEQRVAPVERPSPEPASYRWDELDLTDAAIHEASLFDHEGAELGEAEPPSALRTDDTHTHLKPRGGHLPARHTARASPSAHSGKTFR
jgi:hypothetical protein